MVATTFGWLDQLVVRTSSGYLRVMSILVILLVLALIFGVGSVIEGIAWGFLIVVALIAAAAYYGFKKVAH